MVYFKDINPPSSIQQLVILENEHDPIESGTSLVVYAPICGRYANPWPRLTNPLHSEQWSDEVSSGKSTTAWVLRATHHTCFNGKGRGQNVLPSLGRRIIEGKARWGDILDFAGEFKYIKGYWEWTEDVLSRCESLLSAAKLYDPVYASLFTYDINPNIMKAFLEAWCPSTNTLLTSSGEVSISLWDLHILVGLPMAGGTLYDEVVPSAKELMGIDNTGARFLSRSCSHLFHVYHLLLKDKKNGSSSHVSVERWVHFWSKKQRKYTQPPPRKEKKTVRPKLTHNPNGNLDPHDKWTTVETNLFSNLGIEAGSWTETYLAAYLSCWLCTFVLPSDGTIRPSTFKMASVMAGGRKVNLVVPVLANIYKGINKISNSPRPTRVSSPFPIHFVYGWLAHYFKTHFQLPEINRGPKMVTFSGEGGARYYNATDARRRIHKGDFISWTCNMLTDKRDLMYCDSGRISDKDHSYFMSLRSNYLASRNGDHFIIEPYSPHRFSRQFGYYQEIPGVLKQDIREADLREGLCHWRIMNLTKSMSKVCFPAMPSNVRRFYSNSYKQWWANVCGTFLEDNILSLESNKVSPRVKKHDTQNDQGEKSSSLEKRAREEIENVEPCDEDNEKSILGPLEESGSSNADRHWKRSKKGFQPLEQEDYFVDDEASSRMHPTNMVVKEVEDDHIEIDSDEGSGGNHQSLAKSKTFNSTSSSDKLVRRKTLKIADSLQRPNLEGVSVFVGETVVHKRQKEFLNMLWIDLRDKIMKTPSDFISSIQEDAECIVKEMRRFEGFDISHMEELIKSMFSEASTYDKIKSTSSECVSKELFNQKMNEAKDQLQNAEIKEGTGDSQIKATKDELKRANQKLDYWTKQKKNLSALLKQQEELLKSAHDEVREAKELISAIESTPPLSDDLVESMNTSLERLEDVKKKLIDLNPFA